MKMYNFNTPTAEAFAISNPEDDNLVPLTIIDTSSSLSDNYNYNSNVVIPLPVPERASPGAYRLQPSDIDSLQKEQGFSKGLAETLTTNNAAFPLRIWIVDNSGSMNKLDGHRIIVENERRNKNKKRLRFVDCTRWTELRHTIEYHSQMACRLRAPTVFRMLNRPSDVTLPQQFSIGERGIDQTTLLDEDLTIALQTLQNLPRPVGVTPLTEHIREVRMNVMGMAPSLQADGGRIAIVIATDGLPSNSQGRHDESTKRQFVDALRSLEGLPVWIVIRLCTDDDDVVEFYNDLDEELELSLEVLDDFKGEAAEVNRYNGWLNYALPLHRCREMGYYHRLMDLLDERQLTHEEMSELCILLFGVDKELPDPQLDWKEFMTCITAIIEEEQKQWNPILNKRSPWIDIKKLNKAYRPKKFFNFG